VPAAPAMAGSPAAGLKLKWGTCADAQATAAGWQCATFKVPKDYGATPAATLGVVGTSDRVTPPR